MRTERERKKDGEEGKYEGMEGKKGERRGIRGGSANNLYNTQQYSVAQARSLIIAQHIVTIIRIPSTSTSDSIFLFSYLSFILEIKRMKVVRHTHSVTSQASLSV